MSEEKTKENDWLGCPNSVRAALPKKIQKAVSYAMEECFIELVGTPEAQRDKWLYKAIKARICAAMEEWIKEAIDDAIKEAIEK